jgi:putative ABC transport system permease protein
MNYILFQIKTALKNFGRAKARTFLTSLGILIGVLSVVILIALGVGLRNYIEGQFAALGTNLIFVIPGNVLNENGQFQGGGASALGAIKFDERDVVSLRRTPQVDLVVPLISKQLKASADGQTKSASLFAGNEDLFPVFNFEIELGQVYTASDVGKRSKVVVLGNKLAVDLFGDIQSAVGQKIVVSDQRFSVIGVIKEKGGGGFGGPNYDQGIFMPYTTAFTGISPEKTFSALYLSANKNADVTQVVEDAKTILGRRYKKDDFSVVKQTEILNAITSIFSIINSVLLAIGSISLVVGGIGIMNIMYANVTERTKEVGIRRAIGATKRDVLMQFLVESVLLSLFGGVGGLLLAVIIVAIVQQFFPLAINSTSVVAAIGISTGIGVFFGVFPARRAANLAPIEAIRYE